MRSKDLLLAGVLAVALVATTAVAPLIVEARPAYEIPVHQESSAETLTGPTGHGWSEAPTATVPLSSAPAAVPAADNTTVERVEVQAARTDSRLFLRLSWADATKDTSNERVRSFADTAAVQVPVNASARPPIAMGSTDNPVNVWYWSGSNSTQELLAGGPGTTSQFQNASVTTNYTYDNGRWYVVFSRPLEAQGQNQTTVPTNAHMDVAFAAWNGSNMERSGRKSVSEWYYLSLGPQPSGPPYEAILWAVAGIGIVVTTLVTIEGVRRTRGA